MGVYSHSLTSVTGGVDIYLVAPELLTSTSLEHKLAVLGYHGVYT